MIDPQAVVALAIGLRTKAYQASADKGDYSESLYMLGMCTGMEVAYRLAAADVEGLLPRVTAPSPIPVAGGQDNVGGDGGTE